VITTIKQVHADFFKQIRSAPVIVVYKGANVTVPVIFARQSADDDTETTDEVYPIISIQDHIPVKNINWRQAQEPYVDGYEDTDADGEFDVCAVYQEPVCLDFWYDVAIAAKKRGQYDALVDYMFGKFGLEGQFIFDAKDLGNGDTAGYPIWYKMTPVNILRTDGVQETNFEFRFNCFVDLTVPLQEQLVTALQITLEQINVEQNG
jgi:hypothetical protein